jgi:stearoyl-CoA desaturase (delta-9 desaturase)
MVWSFGIRLKKSSGSSAENIMSDSPSLDRIKHHPIIEPTFGYTASRDLPYKPRVSEVLHEWLDSMNAIKYPTRSLIVLNFSFHFMTAIVFVFFMLQRPPLDSLIFMLASVCALGTIYNTVWYHRYCSHAAFRFRKDSYAKLFLWSNPILFREECYAIPHLIHHQRTEKPGDPYGPHLGWLGNYLATESAQKTNPSLTKQEYEVLVASIAHISLRTNSHAKFIRTGSIEKVNYYLTRICFAQLAWAAVAFAIGGIPHLLAWFSAIFFISFLIRDFNWTGHGGNFRQVKRKGWEFDNKSYALNQCFYGYLASEWHDNHHKYPFSANNGFLPGQFDLAFQIIKLMHRVGIVESYVDARPIFKKDYLSVSA